MSTTPPGPFPPTGGQPAGPPPAAPPPAQPPGGYPPQQPPGGWGGPTGGLPPSPPPKKGMSPGLGILLGVLAGAVVAGLVAFLVLGGDDDDDPSAAPAGTDAPATTGSTTSTTEPDDDPDPTTTIAGGLAPVAVEAADTISETFDADESETACMLEAFAENPDLFEAMEAEEITDPEVMVEILSISKDCLDPDDLAAAFAEGMMEGSDVEVSSEQAACLTEELLDDEDLLATLVIMGQHPDQPPETGQVGPLFELFSTCDLASVLAAGMREGDPTMSEEQSLCVADEMLDLDVALLEEMLGMGTTGGEPSPAMMSALLGIFGDCGISLDGS